jgi:hypothetical protein
VEKISLPFFWSLSLKVQAPFFYPTVNQGVAGVTPNNNEFTTNDLQRAGGIPALMNELSVHLNLDTLTVYRQYCRGKK